MNWKLAQAFFHIHKTNEFHPITNERTNDPLKLNNFNL